MEEQSYGYHTRITSKHSVSTAIVSATCMLRRLVLGEGDAVDDAWLFSFHMHRLVAAESEHLGGIA